MTSKKISNLVACTAPVANTDYLVMVANAGSNTGKCLIETFYNNTGSNATLNNITGTRLFATDNSTPANSTATETAGRIWYDDDYLYIAIGDNVIKRVTLETF